MEVPGSHRHAYRRACHEPGRACRPVFEAANGTKFIGSRTAGANGDVTRLTVPGGITISFSGQEIRHADGRPLQRVGLIPDLEVKPTITGIRAGRDEVLERALEYVNNLPK